MSLKPSLRKFFSFLLIYFLLWIIFFEFVFPSGKILPQPGVVWQSFGALWFSYHILSNFLITLAAIYVSLIIAFFAVKILSNHLIKEKSFIKDFILSLNLFSEYVPGIVLALFLIFWFPDSTFIEFVFTFLLIFFALAKEVSNFSLPKCKPYIDSARSFGLSESLINKKIIWKCILPDLKDYIFEKQIYFWSILIAFEIIKGNSGLGSVFGNALRFKDLSATFAAALIVGIIIFVIIQVLSLFAKKFIHWSEVEL